MSGPGWFLRRILGLEAARRIAGSLSPPAGSVMACLEQAWSACLILGALVPGCDRRLLGQVHLGGLLIALASLVLPCSILACHFHGPGRPPRQRPRQPAADTPVRPAEQRADSTPAGVIHS